MAAGWNEALSKLVALADGKPKTSLGNPIPSNREVSGLILFARAAAAYARDHGLPSASFEAWYTFALPALGWVQQGDKFVMTAAQMDAPYPVLVTDALWQALATLAQQLDDANVPFSASAVGSPIGTDATYKRIAADAWQVMQAQDPPAAAAAHPSRQAQANLQAQQDAEAAAARKKKPAPDKSSSDGGAGLMLLLFALFALDDKRGRRR